MAASLALLLAFSVSGTVRPFAHAIVDHFAEGGGGARLSDETAAVAQRTDEQAQDEAADADSDPDADSDLEAVPPEPAVPPKLPRVRIQIGEDASRDLPPYSETAHNVAAVGVLHRIARSAGWSLTLVGVEKERIDVDLKEADPREAVRQVLKASGSMGVLHRGKLVVLPAPGANSAGMLVEHTRRRERRVKGTRASRGQDMVRVFQGDLVVPAGTVVQGDVVNVGGSIELEPNSVVQGDAVSILGSTVIDQGAVVLGDTAAILGSVEVQRGGQVMGEHVQIGLGKLFRSHGRSMSHQHARVFSLGPFGLFPTLALFAVVYLIGLLILRLWPERVRQVGHAMFEQPMKSFLVGFLCWLLLLPLVLLLLVSVVGIPLVPLLPVMIFLAITMGISSLALRLGEALPAGPGQRFVPPMAMGMGTVVLLLIAFVPWLGVPLLALLQFFALGAAVSSRLGRTLPPHMS
ncbi:MAG: hypothetical protein ACJ79H_13110 [Myxococcales bacterium]